MSKPCEICGREITGTGKRFCSCACRNKAIAAGRKKVPGVFTCAQCGKEFSVIYRLGERDTARKRYCSVGCRNKGQGQTIREKNGNLTCLNCGKEFYRPPSLKAKFCSKPCTDAYHREHGRLDKKVTSKICKNCGKEFTIPTCWFKKLGRKAGSYCSRKCYHEYSHNHGTMFGGKKPWSGKIGIFTDSQGYVHEYDSTTGKYVRQHRLVMERMLGRPLEKGEKVHHRNGKRGDNEPENLELVIGNHFSGKRVRDVYERDIERLALENYRLKQELQELREQLLNSRR